ncbi:hypothetical protein QR680_007594 [Steinernema hermaphroditum]|uniref:Farnesyl pyrophosphate synthase n=1 Tax=Steinernema hermaphroditum TaxID=289476 RepID=A0AA39M5L7_9BILA|nr:hypothetical protein QR680_007594 [Steinernema hermaphroditum]
MATQVAIEQALLASKRLLTAGITAGLEGSRAERVRTRMETLFEETVVGGKYERSRLLVDAYLALKPQGDFAAAVQLSTSIEFMQAFFLVMDDVMDQSETRRGKSCWYRRPDVGLKAINDGLVLEQAADLVVPEHPNKEAMLAAIRQTKTMTVAGQAFDIECEGLNDCTWTDYAQLVERKTSHYTYFCPVQLAMLLADVSRGVPDDDFLDVFGDEKVTGKVGTDLKEGKCTWVTCRALEKASPEDMKILRDNFGKSDDESVFILKAVMRRLHIDNDFQKFQTSFAATVETNIRRLPVVELQPVLLDAVKRIMNRRK